MAQIFTKIYDPPPVDKKQILRYAGVKKESPQITELLDKCIQEALCAFSYRVCYSEFDICKDKDGIDLGFTKTSSKDLEKNLCDCKKIILFAATVGIEIDRLIAKYSIASPSKALMLQALGAERVESLCDEFNGDICSCQESAPRFSAGYGDFPLCVQRDIISALDTQRKIGITLNDSLLMSPSKSVTAIIGIK